MGFFDSKSVNPEECFYEEVNSLIKTLEGGGVKAIFTSEETIAKNKFQAFKRLFELGSAALPALGIVCNYAVEGPFRFQETALCVYSKIAASIMNETQLAINDREIPLLVEALQNRLTNRDFTALTSISLMIASFGQLSISAAPLLRSIFELEPKFFNNGAGAKCAAAIALFSLQKMSRDEVEKYAIEHSKKNGTSDFMFPSRNFIWEHLKFSA